MNEQERTGYEELYRKCWEQQVKKDMAVNPRLREISRFIRRKEQRSKLELLELTEQAAMIDRMLKLNMSVHSISEVLRVSDKSVIQIKARYNLPREETKEN
tara:strand:+ start:6710 stop:7012 length:303 start_codon:yes stop_codon:yes gene_type:complete